MSGNRTGDFFGLPPMNLNGVTEEEMMEMLDRYTNHEEVTTPTGTHFYASDPNHQPSQDANHDPFQTSDDEGAQDNAHDSHTPGAYYGTPQGIVGAESAGTPNNGRDSMTTDNTGAVRSQGGIGTPDNRTAMMTPRTGYAAATPSTAFENRGSMHSGSGNSGFHLAREDPFVTPGHNVRGNRFGFQPSVSNDIDIPDAADLIISPVLPPPSLRFAGPSNANPNGATGSESEHNQRQRLPANVPMTVNPPQGFYESAECLIISLEVVCEQTRRTLAILLRQTENAQVIYDRCQNTPDPEEAKYYWDRYISEIRSQYDSLRDSLWGCVRYLVSRLSVWCKMYRFALPDPVFHRGVEALNAGKYLRAEIDRFRYPDYNAMAIARLAISSNTGNGNGSQQQQQR